MNTKVLGNRGEAVAAEYLKKRHYHLRALQYHSPVGEIDIIAEKNGVLVFVEVKTRRSALFGTPAQAVNYRKQQKIIRTAYWYVQQNHLEEPSCRFDVIEVYCDAAGDCRIQHFENAFEVRS